LKTQRNTSSFSNLKICNLKSAICNLPSFPRCIMRQIQPFALWLGHAGDSHDFQGILNTGIKAVVHLAAEEIAQPMPRDLIYCRFPLLDGPGNDPLLIDLAATMVANLLEKRVAVLVCCGGGMSRSPTIAAAALSMVYQEDMDDCLKKVAEHHPADVAPGLWNEVKSQMRFKIEDSRLHV
jgi:hypothetical protein